MWSIVGITALYMALSVSVALIVILGYDCLDFYLKDAVAHPLASPVFLLCAGLAVLFILCHISRKKVLLPLQKSLWVLPVAGSIPVFLLQVFICYHAYFDSYGCDSFYVISSAYSIAFRQFDYVETAYLALYPNNLALSVMYGLMLRLFHFIFGAEPSIQRFRIMLILFQAAQNVLTGLLLVHLTHRITKSIQTAHLAWFFYLVLIGFSPWFLVPYSDSSALILPLLMFTLFVSRGRFSFLRFLSIGFLAGFGYLLKPQVCVPLIAIALFEIISLVLHTDWRARRLARLSAMLLAACIAVVSGNHTIHEAARVERQYNKSVTFAHYINMGLNPETDGTYSAADLGRALDQPSQTAQIQFCLNNAAERIKSFGFQGLADHVVRKCLVNFSDGSFAWCIDFSRMTLPMKHPVITPFIRNLAYPDGIHYPWLKTLQQACWLLVLAFMPLAAIFVFKNRFDRNTPVLLLTAIGIITFNMLFEAKARYMYIYAPLWILLAAIGIQTAVSWLRKKRERSR